MASTIDTRLLRGERDQNKRAIDRFPLVEIPDCSGGSEIKTWPRSADQRVNQIPDCSGGSEIKTAPELTASPRRDTRLLRGERDQNEIRQFNADHPKIPDCSGGSEIKTGEFLLVVSPTRYQIAPGGARSKRNGADECADHPDTRLLRGERDQNIGGALALTTAEIPDCSGGSEIKTRCSW